MTEPITHSDRFEINPLYMFRWEDTQDAYVLLYPEGVVKLNDTAGEILKNCTGAKTVTDIVDQVKRTFSAPGSPPAHEIERGIRKFLEVSNAKGWIRRTA
ncbi:MAG: pyrroloquinoline quinone biosynthesis peptide chaperone PqqD [Alphaproteobacteria bacterium]